ncbi:hypothetical protein P43SY_002717 [Pythium insidiosum]|uniref:GCVT N-terminal domain-containing protein n=1 Tax=Pythium insidiosum TaxID=114742 RepID=A0AAD5MCW3_PYTIN|nr:hypothetical protein P43SY_002717 [Pythium insidiosum]
MLSRNTLVRLTNRRVLQVRGVDAARFLQGIITNDMKGVAAPQDAVYGAFLTTKGRVLGDCNVVQVEPETFFLDYDAAVETELTKHWKRYKLRMKVTLEDKSSDFATYAALPAAIAQTDFTDFATYAALPAAIAQTDFTCVTPTPTVDDVLSRNSREASAAHGAVFRDPRGDSLGVRAILPTNDTLSVPSDFAKGDVQTYDNFRSYLGVIEGAELGDGIPLESNLELLHGVSFRKGCYVGQELTARTQFKGNVRKRYIPLAMVPSSAGDLAQELAQLPFARIDAESHGALRQYLASAALATAPETGTSLVKPDSSKSVGSIALSGSATGTATAMMRLAHLMPSEDGDSTDVPRMQFTTADGAFHAIPYQPLWWPSLDSKTGKMLL